ncbi:MAG: glycosyltransferase family 4 protein [Lachnospiraceae bacterium]|nr:glycosyltransferase family 4 protein [Lachnospiraceae bacterium]
MHIVYVTPEFETEKKGGGLASYIANISRVLVQNGHKVTIVVSSEKNNDSIIWDKGIVVERVVNQGIKLPVPFYKIYKSWNLHRRVCKVVRENKADLIQYASYDSVGFFKVKKVPSVVRISSDCVMWRELKFYDTKKEDLNKLCLTDKIEYLSIRNSEYIFGPSKAIGELIEKRVGKRVTVIESPFFIKKIDYNYEIYDKLLQGKKYYLSHSSMSCLKGTHIIAEAIQEVCKEDKSAYFVFAGSDHGIFYKNGKVVSVKDYILEKAGAFADKVIFLGTLSREELYPVIERAYACLMPSRADNMPNTCIEAMALGEIVIGTNGASYEQLIEDKKSGLLIDIDDVKGMVERIQMVNRMNDRQRLELSNNAKEVTKRFAPEKVYQSLINYYDSVVKEWNGK